MPGNLLRIIAKNIYNHIIRKFKDNKRSREDEFWLELTKFEGNWSKIEVRKEKERRGKGHGAMRHRDNG